MHRDVAKLYQTTIFRCVTLINTSCTSWLLMQSVITCLVGYRRPKGHADGWIDPK